MKNHGIKIVKGGRHQVATPLGNLLEMSIPRPQPDLIALWPFHQEIQLPTESLCSGSGVFFPMVGAGLFVKL